MKIVQSSSLRSNSKNRSIRLFNDSKWTFWKWRSTWIVQIRVVINNAWSGPISISTGQYKTIWPHFWWRIWQIISYLTITFFRMRWNRRNGCMGVIWQGVNWDHLFSWAVYILFHPKLQIIFDQKNVQMSKSKRQSLTILYYSLYISFTSRRNIRYIDQNNIETC